FLITLLVGLVPAAYADPPDPTWIGGYWDDDDFDTVVAFIASTFATIAQSVVDAEPCLVWIERAEPASTLFARPLLPSPSRPRAPPVVTLTLCCSSPDPGGAQRRVDRSVRARLPIWSRRPQEASMKSARLWTLSMSLVVLATMPARVNAQTPGAATDVPLRDAAAATPDPFERWDF